VPRLTELRRPVTDTGPGPGRAVLASVGCFLRGLPLLVAAVPGTPLRVLCIVALDTLHVLRHSHSLPRKKRQDLATFLDFQACTNAAWDRKDRCAEERQAIQRRLETAGLGPWIEAYLGRLRELETNRPAIGGDRQRFHDVLAYREAVARLSLATIAAIALNTECLDAAIEATHRDRDLTTLFGMAMQCQIIDDVLDYREDLSLGLPSLLTASASLPEAITMTASAARSYRGDRRRASGHGVLPLRLALWVLAAATMVVVRAAGWRLAGSTTQASRGRYPPEADQLPVRFDSGSAGRDNPGAPSAPARWGGSGAASPDQGSTRH
jgi:hypothetical protein